jgi:hypothetical protein
LPKRSSGVKTGEKVFVSCFIMAMTARMACSAQIEFGRIDPHHICWAMRGSRLSRSPSPNTFTGAR